MNPLQVVGDTGVDAVVARTGTAPPPADDPEQEDGLLVTCHQGTAAVALARVLIALEVAGTEHVLRQRHATLLHTLLCADAWHQQAAQHSGDGPQLTPPPPTTDGVKAHGPQLTLGV